MKLSGQFGVAKEGEIGTTESQFWVFELDAKKVKAWMDIAHRGRCVGKACFVAPS